MLVVLDCHPEAKPMNQEVSWLFFTYAEGISYPKNNEGLALTAIFFQSIGLWKKTNQNPKTKLLNEQDYLYIHPRNVTWNLKNNHLENHCFSGSMWGCIYVDIFSLFFSGVRSDFSQQPKTPCQAIHEPSPWGVFKQLLLGRNNVASRVLEGKLLGVYAAARTAGACLGTWRNQRFSCWNFWEGQLEGI